jgi:hypothetical protein
MNHRNWKSRAFVSAAIAVLVAGCSDFKKPNEQNFMNALNSYYSHHEECLFTNTLTFPYETAIKDQSGAGSKGMDALTGSLLMKRQEAKLIGVNRYTLTPAGERAGGRFCYGHREITGITSFTPPVPVNGLPTSTVVYRYVQRDVPIWADTDAMRAAFPALAKSVASDAHDTARLELTINGWALAN